MNDKYEDAAAREIAQCYEDLRVKNAEIEQLKVLLSKAADELEYWEEAEGFLVEKGLIDELRKAAE